MVRSLVLLVVLLLCQVCFPKKSEHPSCRHALEMLDPKRKLSDGEGYDQAKRVVIGAPSLAKTRGGKFFYEFVLGRDSTVPEVGFATMGFVPVSKERGSGGNRGNTVNFTTSLGSSSEACANRGRKGRDCEKNVTN